MWLAIAALCTKPMQADKLCLLNLLTGGNASANQQFGKPVWLNCLADSLDWVLAFLCTTKNWMHQKCTTDPSVSVATGKMCKLADLQPYLFVKACQAACQTVRAADFIANGTVDEPPRAWNALSCFVCSLRQQCL